MHKDKDDILAKGFRKKLGDHKLPLNDQIWKKIEQDLPSEKKSRSIWLHIASAAASIALILSIAWAWNKYHPFASSELTEEMMIAETTNDIPPPNFPNPLADEPVQEVTQPIIQKINLLKSSPPLYAGTKEAESVPEEEKQIEPVELIAENVPPVTTEQKEDSSPKDKKQERIVKFPDFKEDELWAYEEIKKQKKGNHISFGLAYGNQTSSSTPPDNEARLMAYADNFPNSLRVNTYSMLEDILFTDTKYKMPVILSISVRKNLDDKWAIESGLSYTYLETNETSSLANGISNSKDIQMHYVGIPMKLVYSFYNQDRLSLYASAGGMVEKSVYAQERNPVGGAKNKLNIKEPQWSVSGNVGLNYKLVDHLGLFFEPGIAYFFDDKSDVPTIRKDKPFNFNLQLGLRLMY